MMENETRVTLQEPKRDTLVSEENMDTEPKNSDPDNHINKATMITYLFS